MARVIELTTEIVSRTHVPYSQLQARHWKKLLWWKKKSDHMIY